MTHLSRLFAALTVFLCFATSATATPHHAARNGIVYLTFSGLDPKNGAPLETFGTGFFISEDGFLLTSDHLLDQMDRKDLRNVKITGAIADPDAPRRPVNLVLTEKALDLALFRMRLPYGETSEPFAFGATRGINTTQPPTFYTSGFSDGRYTPNDGSFISASDPEVPYVWALRMKVNSGQSGSPVYLEDGKTVVGVLKGTLASDDEYALMVPIEYALRLVPHLTLTVTPQADVVTPTTVKVDPAPVSEPEPEEKAGLQVPRFFMATAKPSFNCAKAKTTAEKVLCSHKGAASADIELGQSYRSARNGMGRTAKTAFRDEQRRWLAYRDDICISDAAFETMSDETLAQVGTCLAKITHHRAENIRGQY